MSDNKIDELNAEGLSEKGLNLQAVLNLSELPAELLKKLQAIEPSLNQFNQILVVGHAGRLFWEKIKKDIGELKHPVDDFSRKCVESFLSKNASVKNFKLIFPSNKPVGLQQLGIVAGWHFESPFRVGINNKWGSWFAYRAVALLESNFKTQKMVSSSPCSTCIERKCVSSCPVDALNQGDLALETCMNYRMSENSQCADRCLSRLACPIANEHQYSIEQIQYHYRLSYRTIKKFNLN